MLFLQGKHWVAEARCGGWWSMIGQKLSAARRIGPLFRIGKIGVQSCCFTTWRMRQGGAVCALQTSPSAVVGYLLWDAVGSPSCGPGGGSPRHTRGSCRSSDSGEIWFSLQESFVGGVPKIYGIPHDEGRNTVHHDMISFRKSEYHYGSK